MDFVTKLSRTTKGYDAIWAIIDRLIKIFHFVATQESSSTEKLADVYMHEIIARHGVLISVVSDCDV